MYWNHPPFSSFSRCVIKVHVYLPYPSSNSQYQLLNGPSLISFSSTLFSWQPHGTVLYPHTILPLLPLGSLCPPLPLLPAAWRQVEMSHKQTALTTASCCFTGCFWHSQLCLSGSSLKMKKENTKNTYTLLKTPLCRLLYFRKGLAIETSKSYNKLVSLALNIWEFVSIRSFVI